MGAPAHHVPRHDQSGAGRGDRCVHDRARTGQLGTRRPLRPRALAASSRGRARGRHRALCRDRPLARAPARDPLSASRRRASCDGRRRAGSQRGGRASPAAASHLSHGRHPPRPGAHARIRHGVRRQSRGQVLRSQYPGGRCRMSARGVRAPAVAGCAGRNLRGDRRELAGRGVLLAPRLGRTRYDRLERFGSARAAFARPAFARGDSPEVHACGSAGGLRGLRLRDAGGPDGVGARADARHRLERVRVRSGVGRVPARSGSGRARAFDRPRATQGTFGSRPTGGAPALSRSRAGARPAAAEIPPLGLPGGLERRGESVVLPAPGALARARS